MLRTVPVLRPFPPGALLVVTRVVLTLCRLAVLTLRTVLVYLLPMRVMVPSAFPLLQMDPLLLCSLMVLNLLAEVLDGMTVWFTSLLLRAILILMAGPLCELSIRWLQMLTTLSTRAILRSGVAGFCRPFRRHTLSANWHQSQNREKASRGRWARDPLRRMVWPAWRPRTLVWTLW